MSDWTAGYVSELGYTYGYYDELNTQRVELCFLNKGLAPPKITSALELGFGQGISINIHAAAGNAVWTGTDFNPSQANFAVQLAEEAGLDCRLLDNSFEELLSTANLPEFDYMGLHGIWSWVSDQNREVITEIIRQKLKVGGVVYVSYNTMPGWAGFAPMRHLMTQHASVLGSSGEGIINRIDDAFAFADELFALKPGYINANPQSLDRLEKIKKQNRHYLAHEFFNKDWHPMHFSQITDLLSSAKLEFAASASLLDHVDTLQLNPAQQEFLNAIPDTTLRETVRDFVLNQQFRKDYWVKGPVSLSVNDQMARVRALRVLLTVPESKISMKIKVGLGDALLNESVYRPIISAIAEKSITTIGEIETVLKSKNPDNPDNPTIAQILQAVVVLVGLNHAAIAQEEEIISRRITTARDLNASFINRAFNSGDISHLASPVTGGGVASNRFEKLFLSSILQAKNEPEIWAQDVWQTLSGQGQKVLTKEGVKLETEEENLEVILSMANDFAEHRLQIFKRLGIL